MAEAEASGSVSAWRKWWRRWWRGGEGGAGEHGGVERVAAAEGRGSMFATAGMSGEEIASAINACRQRGLWSVVPRRDRGRGRDRFVWEQLKDSSKIFRDTWSMKLKLKEWKALKITQRWRPGELESLKESYKSRDGKPELGRVIAEGGQAQIYQASLDGDNDVVAKVFKMEGFSLVELQRQWPRTRAKVSPTPLDAVQDYPDNPAELGEVVFGDHVWHCSTILMATYMPDGRFAFVMKRYWGDLRTLIDLKLKDNNSQGPPFSLGQALMIMRDIALGMRELHKLGVLHKDLKAANVLVCPNGRGDPVHVGECECHVADYECAMLVQGTGFWRAPEVLEELLKQPCDRKNDIWTEKVDAYSYAMTCSEVLTGCIPFPEYTKKDWMRVIDGERPYLSNNIDRRVCDLLERCWHKDPSERPHFQAIMVGLEDIIWLNREGEGGEFD